MKHPHLSPLVVLVALVAGCASSDNPDERSGPDASTSSASSGGSSTDDDHGDIEGAEELAEPPLHLLTLADDGRIGLLDLVDGTASGLGRVPAPGAASSDGRYVFATTAQGLEVIDSGLWTWDHGDHFHYYRSAPALIGTVSGRGDPTIAHGSLSTAGGTGVYFPESGEAVLLDNETLADGELRERFRLDLDAHEGLVAPLGDGAIVTVPDGSGGTEAVQRYDADGDPVAGSVEKCIDPRGSITTAVGLVIGCAGGALLWTKEGDGLVVERIPYPGRLMAPRAREFRAREGRPTVAALAGDTGIWLLDTRERTWHLIDAGATLRQVSAADDEEGHVVALDRSGRVRVYVAESGKQVAVSAPMLTDTVAGPGVLAGVQLVVDDQRAYLNDPGGDRVLEIDYADGARVARELSTSTAPDFYAEVGR